MSTIEPGPHKISFHTSRNCDIIDITKLKNHLVSENGEEKLDQQN
jgi:hypothetical protein